LKNPKEEMGGGSVEIDLGATNQKAYQKSELVKHYVRWGKLLPPEAVILNLLKNRLAGMRMLDIGVGGGRTTTYFSNLVSDYVGIDYSPEMVSACQARLSDFRGKVSFGVGDVRNMSQFPENAFDFILFSFNGIDGISWADRKLALREIHRVGKPGGYFCFSSHNLQSLDEYFKFKMCGNPLKIPVKIAKYILLRIFNGNYRQLLQRDYTIIRDGAHFFKINAYYVKPEYQAEQLRQAGFDRIRIFKTDGLEVKDNFMESQSNWLYYLCEVIK
jgi:ubiquinone/menaquinone biosynthesis C-methylase UbiE